MSPKYIIRLMIMRYHEHILSYLLRRRVLSSSGIIDAKMASFMTSWLTKLANSIASGNSHTHIHI